MQRLGWLVVSVALVQFGCGSSGSKQGVSAEVSSPHIKDHAGAVKGDDLGSGAAGQAAPPVVAPPVFNPGPGITAPAPVIDTRVPVTQSKAPPPISGGTLIVMRDGTTAVAADPDRDRVSIVDLPNGKVLGHVALKAGDEPGRLIEDADGRVHVALRGAGVVATIDVSKLKVTERRSVCGAPRGIAYDASSDALQVACTGGELVTLPAAGGAALRSTRIEPDLRDVLVDADGHVVVSQFRSATLLELDAKGAVSARHRPPDEQLFVAIGATAAQTGPRERPFQPALARRTVALGNGGYVMLHARELADTVEVPDPHDPSSMGGDPGLMKAPDGSGFGGGIGNAYGGGSCDSIVQTGISMVAADGSILQSANVASTALPVDLAVSPDGSTIAIANAGTRDPQAPNFLGGFGVGLPPLPPGAMIAPAGFANGAPAGVVTSSLDPNQVSGTVVMLNTGEATFHTDSNIPECTGNAMGVPGQPTAVAFAPDGALVIQSREPASLIVMTGSSMSTINLGGESMLDTGHELFHRDAGAGLACASCHGEAGDDGHVWQFSDSGERRTQSVNIGLAGTQPFHWSGDMKDLPMLVDRVFVGRMGGVSQSPERVDALSHWLFAQQPPARIRVASDEAALRGKALFESSAVGCANCHSGEKFTNSKTVDVGTGGAFQVPSLVGIGYRAPFIHNGCAATLRERFDPACGGKAHGDTKQLDGAQIGDLVAYLESL